MVGCETEPGPALYRHAQHRTPGRSFEASEIDITAWNVLGACCENLCAGVREGSTNEALRSRTL